MMINVEETAAGINNMLTHYKELTPEEKQNAVLFFSENAEQEVYNMFMDCIEQSGIGL